MVEKTAELNGYKVTEVGLIPQDWDVRTLGEVFTFFRTGNNSRSDLDGNGEINYIHYGDIHTKWNTTLNAKEEMIPYVSSNKIKDLPTIKNGDLIMADASEDYEGIGKSIEVKNIGNRIMVSGLHTFLMRGNKEVLLDGFKGYIQYMNPVKDALRKISTGISVYGISKYKVKNVQFPVPPLEEQKAIAEVLTDTDNTIISLRKLIDKKEKIKQGVMQQLLTGKKRLPGFNREWVTEKIKNIASISTGSKNTQDNNPNGAYPFFVRSSTIESIDSYSFDGEAVLTAGDGVGTGKVFHYIDGKFDFHQRVYKISDFNSQVNGYYFYLYFSFNFLNRIMAMTAKSSVDSVRMEMIADMEVLLPEISEQKAIAQVLYDMEAEIEALEEKLEKYKKIKQGMMQELLTGRIRLK